VCGRADETRADLVADVVGVREEEATLGADDHDARHTPVVLVAGSVTIVRPATVSPESCVRAPAEPFTAVWRDCR